MPVEDLIYLDHAATTPVDPRVLEAMLPYLQGEYGNPSTRYQLGMQAFEAISSARALMADLLNAAKPPEIIFTSCGTESDNLAIRGVARATQAKGRHIITSAIEHHAVLNTCASLQREEGYEVTYVPVDHEGLVHPEDVAAAIRPDTVLVSVMYANNEMGAIQPIAEIGAIAHERGVYMHTDAVQAAGHLPIDVQALNADLLSLSGHKFYAPKGVGALYVREGVPILPRQTGGGQEFGLRAGTENVPYIVGMAKALALACAELPTEIGRLTALRDRLIDGVLSEVPDAYLVGHRIQRLPGLASFVFEGIDGEAAQLHLDLNGIACGTGSACASNEEGASAVLVAMGIEPRLALSALRFSLGRSTTAEHIDRVIEVLPAAVARLRELSPYYQPARAH
ncbi:MAG: cysteine desulfurase family protein [Anaerolineales bacterium]